MLVAEENKVKTRTIRTFVGTDNVKKLINTMKKLPPKIPARMLGSLFSETCNVCETYLVLR